MSEKKEKKENQDNKIYLNANVNEVFATSELTQNFMNPSDNPIELQIQFPIKENINLSKFEIIMKDKKVISKILNKEKAKEKYSDSIAQGNTAIKSEYSKSFKSYNVNIGNLGPKESLQLKTIYNQSITSYDMSYEYIIMKNFPSFVIENNNEEEEEEKSIHPEIIINININTFSKITRLITNFKNKENFNITYNNGFKEAKINYLFKEDLEENYETDLHILFRTNDMNEPNLFFQFNPILKKYSYCLNYLYISDDIKKLIEIPNKPDEDDTISYFTKYQSNLINQEPGLFIFLVDQSGSMSGTPINLVTKSLLIFIQSLPKNSYFQIIGFGSNFEKYNDSPVEYNSENINKIKEIIKNLTANMGGTDIVSPLKSIFENKSEYEKINLSKNILLLTDGEVEDKNECFDLIKDNSNLFRIHSIGIGNDFDKELIKLCGQYGKGSSNFVKDLTNINNTVINILNNCLRPYLYDIKFTFLNINKEDNNSIFVKSDNFIYQDEIINYSFILNDELKKTYIDSQGNIFKFKIEFIKNLEKTEKNIEFKNIMNLPEGDNMTKIIIDKYLKNNTNIDEKKEIELAKKYEVLSKNTSLFAEIINEKSQQKEIKQINILSKNSHVYSGGRSFYRGRVAYAGKAARMSYSFACARRSTYTPSNSSSGSESEKCLGKKRQKATKNKRTKYQSSKKKEKEKEEEELDEEECEKDYDEENDDDEKSDDKNEEIDLVELMTSQDAINGFWVENEYTKKIEKLLSVDIIENINKICLKCNKKEKKTIFFTILVIYFISNKYKSKIDEYKLVLNKAKNYLKKQKINYDQIISKMNIK